jgi:hypothetical protein
MSKNSLSFINDLIDAVKWMHRQHSWKRQPEAFRKMGELKLLQLERLKNVRSVGMERLI